MPRYTKESLERLKSKIDLLEVLSRHVEMKRMGAVYKGLCPFHEERSPSFMVRERDAHYHCFGCGAHGDAITFLMEHLKLTFSQSIERLAEQFQVSLDVETQESLPKGDETAKNRLKQLLAKAALFYHSYLIQSQEGEEPLRYLLNRGIGIDFIRAFWIGVAPQHDILSSYLRKNGFKEDEIEKAGLLVVKEGGKKRPFFSERITFPILDAFGNVIGFSARKWREEVFGGKYINSPETALFKKSRILFGLAYSRRRIIKDKMVLIVEGQLDALQLIACGYDCTIAALGTAFGEEHAEELRQLGTLTAYLLFDADSAGLAATIKVGHLLQQKGIEPLIVQLPNGEDPDSFVRKRGSLGVYEELLKAQDLLSFMVQESKNRTKWRSPSEKMHEVNAIVKRIKEWKDEVLIHESLKKLAKLADVPPNALGVVDGVQKATQRTIASAQIDKEPFGQALFMLEGGLLEGRMEEDLLRWLLLAAAFDPYIWKICKLNIGSEYFKSPLLGRLYDSFLQQFEQYGVLDLLSLHEVLPVQQLSILLEQLKAKKLQKEKAREQVQELILKLKQKRLFDEREAVRRRIISGEVSEEETQLLTQLFDQLKNLIPQVEAPLTTQNEGEKV